VTSCRRNTATETATGCPRTASCSRPASTPASSGGAAAEDYDDLLAPYWKDKIIWKQNDLSGGPGFIGNVLTHMGEARGMD